MSTNATLQPRRSSSRRATGPVVTLTLNRGEQFNPLSSAAMIADLQAAIDGIAADREVRVVVLAAGGRGFCAGHDLKEIRAQMTRLLTASGLCCLLWQYR